MTEWVTVIKHGTDLNITLSSIQFDEYGTPTKQKIIICNSWKEGIEKALCQGYTHVLFVNSGTVFVSWPAWKELVNTYPHRGLIAHIIWHPGQHVKFDEQCWFMDITQFDADIFDSKTVTYPLPVRSNKDLHDDYTPLWIKPGLDNLTHAVDGFGQAIIAQHLANNNLIVNWNNSARDLKYFLYPHKPELLTQYKSKIKNYIALAENQLWILNNEPISVVNAVSLLTPGSGLFWILNIINDTTSQIQIVDISKTQLTFCQLLWTEWDGSNYGEFVWKFINQHNLQHYQLDNPDLTKLEQLKLKKQSVFVEYVNKKVEQALNDVGVTQLQFQHKWNFAKQNKTIKFNNDNLINWVLTNGCSDYDYIWTTNILSYKWTLLNSTSNECDKFLLLIK
tara:strand:+ start:120 stop:1298 length:1179 start_codon:yes stop_codon:yes gene_type:complete